ncbi:response regulator [Collimonas pratensis]|uniref:Response regulator n=2 Tax=Oxalobacteraceae TaxID=75682 RepID=A0A127PXJ5_9BURK|nr:response regulator [Collimonas pratensis]
MRLQRAAMNISLPVYQHPTLTILIDDSQSFLDSLAFQLPPQMARKVFHDTQAALEWLRDAYRHSPSKSQSIRVNYDEQTYSFDRRTVAVDIDQIYRQSMNRRRFMLPSVLVIDYAMPQMNGLAFCQAVQDLPCKKILFTGQADEKIAIEAFNRGLIDRFIKKSDHDALDHLEMEIRTLQKEFFHAQSLTLKDLLSRHSYTFLSDPALEALVEQLCKRHGFVEYYLFPNPTGILFFDIQGKATLMVVETEASLMSQLEVAQDYGAPLELLTGLREMRLVPFFSDTGGMYTDALRHDWISYCLPAQICFGAQDYYWALFDFPAHYLRDSFYSFAEFLRDQSADVKS